MSPEVPACRITFVTSVLARCCVHPTVFLARYARAETFGTGEQRAQGEVLAQLALHTPYRSAVARCDSTVGRQTSRQISVLGLMTPRGDADGYEPANEQPQYPTINTEAEHSHDKGWDPRARLYGIIIHTATVKNERHQTFFCFAETLTAGRIYFQQACTTCYGCFNRPAPTVTVGFHQYGCSSFNCKPKQPIQRILLNYNSSLSDKVTHAHAQTDGCGNDLKKHPPFTSASDRHAGCQLNVPALPVPDRLHFVTYFQAILILYILCMIQNSTNQTDLKCTEM